MGIIPAPIGHIRLPKILVAAAAGLILGIWLYYTPAGLLGKADAVAYAVCHRIATRSFFIGDRQVPLCARCSGMYLGALIGLLYQLRQGRRGKLPPLKISLVLGLFFLAFGMDGVNSYLHFFPNAPVLYDPENWLRLVTGTGMGLGMAAVVFPIFNQSIWLNWKDEPALFSWKQLAALLVISMAVVAAVLSENPLLLYPLAVLGSMTVVVLLTLIYTIVWTLIAKKENTFQNWDALWIFIIAGFATAILQVAVMDAGRFLLTGTWAGFNLN